MPGGELLMAGALARLADRVIPQTFVSQDRRRRHDRGISELKQKDFGITPISLGGGTVRVKNLKN
jgi:hypothetical protein